VATLAFRIGVTARKACARSVDNLRTLATMGAAVRVQSTQEAMALLPLPVDEKQETPDETSPADFETRQTMDL
jgi:hypothetical protein